MSVGEIPDSTRDPDPLFSKELPGVASKQQLKEQSVFPTPTRLYRRAIVLVVTSALLVTGIGAMAQAASPRLDGTTSVSGPVVPRSNIALTTDFGTMKSSGTYLFNTEVRDANNAKVAQWTNTFWVYKGQRVKRSYGWNTAATNDGKYTFSIGISKPNWTGLIGWSDTAGSIVLGANGWNTSSVASFDVDGTTPVDVAGRFVAPSNARGSYLLQMDVVNGSSKVASWNMTSWVSGSKTLELVRSLPRPVAGTYTVQTKVLIGGVLLNSNNSAGSFTMATPLPPTTTTTVSPTTTTVVPKPAPPVTTDGGNGLTDLPGWKMTFNENFNTNAAEGSFLSTYKNFGAYNTGWKDTSKNGTYSQDIISTSGGNMMINLRTNSAGQHLVAAPTPKTNNGSGDQLYGRYSVRFKADQVAGYKTAWLLWPKSDDWNEGEIDFPEGNLNGKIDAFSHYTGDPRNQSAFSTGATFADWHVATTEWSPGKVVFYLDGKVIGTATRNIPNTPMHWVLQTETQLDGGAPANNVSGTVYVDWVAAWAYQG